MHSVPFYSFINVPYHSRNESQWSRAGGPPLAMQEAVVGHDLPAVSWGHFPRFPAAFGREWRPREGAGRVQPPEKLSALASALMVRSVQWPQCGFQWLDWDSDNIDVSCIIYSQTGHDIDLLNYITSRVFNQLSVIHFLYPVSQEALKDSWFQREHTELNKSPPSDELSLSLPVVFPIKTFTSRQGKVSDQYWSPKTQPFVAYPISLLIWH